MLVYFRCFCSTVYDALCSALSITHPSETVVNSVHLLNLITRLLMIAMGVVVATIFPSTYEPLLPVIAMPPYTFSEWDDMAVYDWKNDELPGMKLVAAPENPAVVLFFSFIVFSLFCNDLFRCGFILRNEWNASDNQIDFWWYMMGFISIPCIFAFTALSLGTHDVATLLLIGLLTFTSSVAASVKELLRSLINTETTPFMQITVMSYLQMIHDLSLFTSMIVTLLPFMYNLVYAHAGVSSFAFATAIIFEMLYLSMVTVQYSYEARCSILENRWPSHRCVILWGLPRQEPLWDSDALTAGVVFSRPNVTNEEEHANTEREIEDSADPFSVETSEELYDKIYFGCASYHVESASEHRSRQMQLSSPIGSGSGTFHKYTDEVGQGSRQIIGRLVEWRRYYTINMFINCLMVLGVLNISGLIVSIDFAYSQI